METKTEQGLRERTLIDVANAHDVKYWTEVFGASDDELREAVSAVGKSVAVVETYLKKNKA